MERSAQAPAGLCATSKTNSGVESDAGITWNRPGQRVSRMPLLDGFGGDRESLLAQFFGGRNRQRDIAQLMATDQRRLDQNLFSHNLQGIAGDWDLRPSGLVLRRSPGLALGCILRRSAADCLLADPRRFQDELARRNRRHIWHRAARRARLRSRIALPITSLACGSLRQSNDSTTLAE